jgi:ubiquinol-cytochrome c reductase cytochrome c1 subunit
MRTLRSIFSGRSVFTGAALLAGAALLVSVSPARAQEGVEPPSQKWSFQSIFGTYDLAAAQRGFQIYSEVCSNCHSMNQMYYRNLSEIGLTQEQIKAVAAAVQVPAGLNDQGEAVEGPGTPASRFRAPFPNEKAARASNNGALPPDLSLIVNARPGGPNYVFGILTGYGDAPADIKMQDGMNYNKYFPGHQIAMPQPLSDGQMTYADGTANTLDQEAHDVVTFLSFVSNPELVERKKIGARIVLFLILMTGVTYAVKRRVWADVHH